MGELRFFKESTQRENLAIWAVFGMIGIWFKAERAELCYWFAGRRVRLIYPILELD